MILIDAVYINTGGGLVLLNYLIEQLELNTKEVHYLLDHRATRDFDHIPDVRKKIIRPSYFERFRFYMNHKDSYSRILCFGNIPPPIKTKSIVYTYVQNNLLLELPFSFPLKLKYEYRIKREILRHLSRYTDYFIVQTDYMREQIFKSIEFPFQKIFVIPFYSIIKPDMHHAIDRVANSFLYVSSGAEYKNHNNLLKAFCMLVKIHESVSLTLTVEKQYKKLYKTINNHIESGCPISNIEFLDRSELVKIYYKNEYVIYPSLIESFGLGILEAIECQCKVIASDLPYTYAVCSPSIIFNPKSVDSILESMSQAINKQEKPTLKLVDNEIDDLLTLLIY